MEKVQFLKLNFDSTLNEKLNQAMARVNSSGYYIQGNELKNFEAKFAKFCGVSHCAGISNGLDALVLALKVLGLGAGDVVAVPGNTFIATWFAVSQIGAKILPIDADIETGQMSIPILQKQLESNPNIKAVIVVHLYGAMGDMDSILKLCKDKGIPLLEDAAQAHGSSFKGKKAGAWGDMAAFSFYPGKNLGALGDAGAIVCNNADLDFKVRTLRNYGSQKKYYHDSIGFNHRLDEIQAAVLNEKMSALQDWNDRREAQVAQYQKAFAKCKEIHYFKSLGDKTAWHLFVILVKDRLALQSFLSEQGIETLIHYPIACHNSGAYEDLHISDEMLPVSSQIANQCLSLPIGPHLDDAVIDRVSKAVLAFFGQ